MQLSAVCAAATVSTRPGRQTEEGCSLRLTLLTRGQHNATNKAGAKKKRKSSKLLHPPCWGCSLALGDKPKISNQIASALSSLAYSVKKIFSSMSLFTQYI